MSPAEQALRDAYAKTAFARMGIPYERAIERRSIRNLLNDAVRVYADRQRKAA